MKQIIVTGKTYEEALQDGLFQLRAIITDVDVVTLEEGSKGLFGLFGSRPYKLQLTLREEEEVDPTAALFPVEKKAEPKPERPARKEPKPEKKPEPKPEAPKAEAAPVAQAPKAEEAPAAKPEAEKKPDAPKPVQRKAKQPREKKSEAL